MHTEGRCAAHGCAREACHAVGQSDHTLVHLDVQGRSGAIHLQGSRKRGLGRVGWQMDSEVWAEALRSVAPVLQEIGDLAVGLARHENSGTGTRKGGEVWRMSSSS